MYPAHRDAGVAPGEAVQLVQRTRAAADRRSDRGAGDAQPRERADATASGPRCDTQNTSTTANTDSITISSTIGIASSTIDRPIAPVV